MDTITVVSSYKLKPAELSSVAKIAQKQLGSSGDITNIVDKSIIAGIKIVAGGRELDLSMHGAISRLGTALT